MCSQNKPIVFGLGDVPQNTLINPSFVPSSKLYVGTGLSFNLGFTGVNLHDVFGKSSGNFTNKVTKAIAQLNSDDVLAINTQVDVFNVGYRINETLFVSGGFYGEADFFSYFPKDIAILMHEGNAAYLHKSFRFEDLAMKGDVLGVLHFGVAKKINEDLTLGGRLKIYSSSVNVFINNSRGTFLTEKGTNNLLKHYLNNFNVEINTANIFVDGKTNKDPSSYFKDAFLKGNTGFGVDIGFSYKLAKNTTLSASLLDVGYISYSKNIRNYKISGDYTFEGINFLYDKNDADYWNDLENDFDAKVPSGENNESYTAWRPIKFFSLLKHDYGEQERRLRCYGENSDSFHKNSVGLQLFAIRRPLSVQGALTGFYQRRLLENTALKLTYTIDDYSMANFGVGFTTQLGPVNIFGAVDNIFNTFEVDTTQSASVQIGINLIFNNNE